MPTMRICIAGCPTLGIPVYKFPPETDPVSRDLWFGKFGLHSGLYANKTVYICRRHFSAVMTFGRSLRYNNAYPDVNLRKYNKHMPYTEQYSEYYRDGNPPPGEYKVMAISECTEKETPPIKKAAHEIPVTELSDTEVAEITLSQSEGEQSPSKDLETVESSVQTYVPYQKRQCVLKCPGRRKFHILPSIETELERRKKWLYLLAKDPDLYQSKYHYVCDLHFDIHMVGMSKLIRGAYPNANLPPPLQKSIQENLEAKTECFQKCTDYKRKYRFPSVQTEGERRKMWLRKFGRDPEFYDHDIYACDRHFSDEMRVGPYLRREAVPDQNLKRVLSEVENAENCVGKKCSIQRLNPLVQDAPRPTAPFVQVDQNLERVRPEIENNVNFVSKNWNTKRLQTLAKDAPKSTAPVTQIPKTNIQPKLLVLGNSTPAPESPATPAESSKKHNILNRLNMTMLPPVQQAERPHSPVQYVKMHTLGVFVPRREGYVAAVDKILSAEDPLDVEKFNPVDWVKPIEPELPMDVQVIESKNYGDVSSDDERAAVELSDSDEVNSTHEESAESENDIDWQACRKRRGGEVRPGETKKLKLAQAQTQSRNVAADSAQFLQFLRTRIRQSDGYLSDLSFDVSDSEAEADGVVKDDILEHLSAKYPTENFSILLGENNKVVEYGKDAGVTNSAEDIITPVKLSVAEADDKRLVGTTSLHTLPKEPSGVEVGNGSLVVTTIGSTPPTQAEFPQHSTTDFAERFLMTQRKQRPRQNLLTNEVALAESWQQVIETIEKEHQTSGMNQTEGSTNLATTSKQTEEDKLAAAMKTTTNKRKKVGGPNATRPVTAADAAAARRQQATNAFGRGTANRLLAKPKRLLNATKNGVLENDSSVGLSDPSTLKAEQMSCIIDCDTFHKLYAFPSAETEPHRRHFWLLELRMKITANWHKSLYICDNHFEKSMLIENSLHKYAYPCKELKHEVKVTSRNADTQTNSNTAEQPNYKDLLSELTNLEELECRQAKEINRIKVLIRLKQEAMRLVAEIESSKEALDVK